MAKFNVGDKVAMPGIPVVVERCSRSAPATTDPAARWGEETFRFTDPGGLGDDWMHTSEFEKAEALFAERGWGPRAIDDEYPKVGT